MIKRVKTYLRQFKEIYILVANDLLGPKKEFELQMVWLDVKSQFSPVTLKSSIWEQDD